MQNSALAEFIDYCTRESDGKTLEIFAYQGTGYSYQDCREAGGAFVRVDDIAYCGTYTYIYEFCGAEYVNNNPYPGSRVTTCPSGKKIYFGTCPEDCPSDKYGHPPVMQSTGEYMKLGSVCSDKCPSGAEIYPNIAITQGEYYVSNGCNQPGSGVSIDLGNGTTPGSTTTPWMCTWEAPEVKWREAQFVGSKVIPGEFYAPRVLTGEVCVPGDAPISLEMGPEPCQLNEDRWYFTGECDHMCDEGVIFDVKTGGCYIDNGECDEYFLWEVYWQQCVAFSGLTTQGTYIPASWNAARNPNSGSGSGSGSNDTGSDTGSGSDTDNTGGDGEGDGADAGNSGGGGGGSSGNDDEEDFVISGDLTPAINRPSISSSDLYTCLYCDRNISDLISEAKNSIQGTEIYDKTIGWFNLPSREVENICWTVDLPFFEAQQMCPREEIWSLLRYFLYAISTMTAVALSIRGLMGHH